MPYRKKYKCRSQCAKSIAKLALKKVNKINKAVEVKFYDTNMPLIEPSFHGTIIELNALGQGLTDSQRVGDKIRGTSFSSSWRILNNQLLYVTLRFILIWDKLNTINSTDQILMNTTGNQVLNSDYVVDRRVDFTVLYDRRFNMTSGHNRVSTFKINKKLNKTVTFQGGSQDIDQGSLKLIIFSNEDGTGDLPLVSGYSRFRYKDL